MTKERKEQIVLEARKHSMEVRVLLKRGMYFSQYKSKWFGWIDTGYSFSDSYSAIKHAELYAFGKIVKWTS